MRPQNWGQIRNINMANRNIEDQLARLARLAREAGDENEDAVPPRVAAPNRALPPVRLGAPDNNPPRKGPPRMPPPPVPQPRPAGRQPQFAANHPDDDDDDDDDGEENMMMMRPPVPRGNQPQRAPAMIERRPVNVRRQNEPMGNIRYANGQLRSAVSWMFTLRLSNDPRRVNYFPYAQDPHRIQRVNGQYVRPYVVPTLRQLGARRNAPQFILYQLEMGDNGVLGHDGRPLHDNLHYQGFMEFPGKVSAVEICLAMGWTPALGWNMGDVWLEPRQGRKEDAIAYVTKDDTAFAVSEHVADFALGDINEQEFADAIDRLEDNEQGQMDYFRREDGQQRPPDAADMAGIVTHMIQEGASYHDILMAYPSYALQRTYGIKAAIDAIGEKKGGKLRHRQVQTFVFWGDSRTGKSRKIAEMEGDEELVMDQSKVYVKNRKEHYYQHYVDQEVLVLDEFVGANGAEKMTIDDLLQILDGQNLSLAIKHGSPRFARWKRVYITSNIAPRLWFPNADPAQLEALYRRLETGGITKFVDSDKPASVLAHEAEVVSDTYKRDRANVVIRSSRWE